MLFKPGPVISPLVDSPILPKQAGKVRAEAEAEAALRARLEETTAAVAVAAEASQGAKRATEASEDASQQRRLAADKAIAASWALEHHRFAAKVRDMMPEILKKVAEEENAKQARRMEHRGVNGWIMSIDAWCMWFRQTSDIRSSPTCVQKAKVRLLFRRSM